MLPLGAIKNNAAENILEPTPMLMCMSRSAGLTDVPSKAAEMCARPPASNVCEFRGFLGGGSPSLPGFATGQAL